jgi:predicted nuclease of predicted toxin-antitoxin system
MTPIRFLADEDFDNNILRGLLARDGTLDIVRAQDCGLSQTPDVQVLEWAAKRGRVILTHDENTMVGDAYSRVTSGLPMPGVVLVHQWTPIARAIDDVLFLAQAGTSVDFDQQVIHVPLPP